MKKRNLLLSFILGLVALTGFSQEKYFDGVENTKTYSVIELAENDDRFSIFLNFLEASGMDTSIEYTEGYTIFMPTNEAFGNMEVEKLNKLGNPENQSKLVNFVKNYILPTKVQVFDFEDSQVIDVEGDETIDISTEMNSGIVNVGGAEIIQGDVEAKDGIIHVIDRLITPTPDFGMN